MKMLIFILAFLAISPDLLAGDCKITITRARDNAKVEYNSKDVTFSINPEDDSVSHVNVTQNGKEEKVTVLDSGSDLLRQASKCKKEK